VQELKLAFEERNGFLQVMYGRESRLLTRVEELTKAIEHLKKMQEPALEPARK
jgi:hypothetical protein